ncbi:MAG: hypothetical protein CL827_01125 [Crocinitomicaceae bacterium]|nr:hypothetical protein [Crocinitomicaceae bacterium]
MIYTRSFPGTDQLNQFGSSVNFLNGFGFVTKYFDGENLFVRPVNNWPIFYSLFSSLLLFFTKNTVFTFMISTLFSKVFLSVVVYKLYKSIFTDNYNFAFNIFITVIALSLAPIGYGSDIDIITASSFLLSLLFLHKYYFVTRSVKSLFFFFLIITAICHMRYAYLPKVALYLLFVFIYDLHVKNFKNQLFLKILLSSIVILNIITIYYGEYFQKTTEDILLYDSANLERESFWHLLYAPLANSFFPDFIVFNFLHKVLGDLVNNHYIIFVLIMMGLSVSIFYLLLKAIITSVKFKKISASNFILVFLFLFIFINLIVLFLVYGPSEVYPKKQINNTYQLSYDGLAIVNRYLILLHLSVFTLALHYAINKNVFYFKTLVTLAVFFGFLHFIYLNSIYSHDRKKNLFLLSKPEGVLIDCNAINNIFTESYEKNVLFCPLYTIDSMISRQVSPIEIAKSNGLVIFTKLANLHIFESSLTDFESVYYCHYSGNASFYKKNKHDIVYKGNIYTLYKKK